MALQDPEGEILSNLNDYDGCDQLYMNSEELVDIISVAIIADDTAKNANAGRSLGREGTKRRCKILQDSIQGITKHEIR
ncbi:1228_t:CDS:2 [Entrophospora sp. SA101]|nr:1228_t:CDS:2 [Entrophospora sp. SA101]